MTLSFALGAVAAPVCVQAGEITPHVSAGLALADIDNGGLDYTATILRGGVDLNRFLGAEVEGSFGISGSNFSDDASGSLKSQYGAFGVIGLPVGDNFKIYSRWGYMSYTREVEFDGNEFGQARTSSNTSSFLAFGIGVQAMFGENHQNGVRFDATSFPPINSGDDEGFFDNDTFISLAYVRRF